MRAGIVGGGIIGWAVAWRLARRGAEITLFEQRATGAGATQASAGALVPYVEAHQPGPLQDLVVRSLTLYDAFIDEVRAESRLPIDYDRCGSLEVAFTDSEAIVLQEVARRYAAAGVRWADARETRHLEPALADTVRGSILVASHGYVAASALTAALAAAATRRGTIQRTARVKAIRTVPDGAEITTDAGAADRFDRVFICAGAWANLLELDEGIAIPVRPVKGQLLRLRGVRLSRLVWSRKCYVVPQRTGDALIGATMEDAGFDERATVEGVSELLNAVRELMPSIVHAQFVEARVGLRPATADHLPIIGYSRATESVVFAVGHFRNGIVLAPLTAQILSDLVVDGVSDPALAALTPARFGL